MDHSNNIVNVVRRNRDETLAVHHVKTTVCQLQRVHCSCEFWSSTTMVLQSVAEKLLTYSEEFF